MASPPKRAYFCSKGHYQEAPFELTSCQAMDRGKPCTGVLRELKQRGRPRKQQIMRTQ